MSRLFEADVGPSGEGHVRMAYCVDDETIDGAFPQLAGCMDL